MARFTMQSFSIDGEGALTLAKSASFDAASDNAAADTARSHSDEIVPDVGGDFEIVVTALDPGIAEVVRNESGAYVPRPPGEISRWVVSHEPADHVRDLVYAERAAAADAKAKAEERSAMRAEILAEIAAEQSTKGTP